jgi:exodeoxyribonuclease-3
VPKIASWNVNSIKARLTHLERWLQATAPDIVLLQETKVTADAFPTEAVEDLGYNVATVGQKSYNGVAILAKRPIEILASRLPDDPADEQARYLEGFTDGIRVASVYAPNGNPTDGEKFPYKLRWLERLHRHAADLLRSEDCFVLGGDFNVVPTATDADVYDPPGWQNDALCRPESRAALRTLCHLGLTDALRAIQPDGPLYTWWDYRAGAWSANHGLRIDHLLLSPQAADRLLGAGVDLPPRGWERTSDHAPNWCELTAP